MLEYQGKNCKVNREMEWMKIGVLLHIFYFVDKYTRSISLTTNSSRITFNDLQTFENFDALSNDARFSNSKLKRAKLIES